MKTSLRFASIIVVTCISLFLVTEAKAIVYMYEEVDIDKDIPDEGTITTTMTVPDVYSIKDVNVILNITHTWDSDVSVYLISPQGIEIELFSGVGSGEDNFENTILDDEAMLSIRDGNAPFIGSYRPIGNLKNLYGQDANGVWTLQVSDMASSDTGTLHYWALIMEPCVEPPPATGPNPPNGTTDLAVNTCLAWAVGDVESDATWDLYLGTNPNSLVRIAADLTSLSHCPGPLGAGKRYYWRVDVKNPCLRTTGPVWMFEITKPPVAQCRDITVTADRSCQVFVTVEDVDWHSYDPNDDPITLAIDSTGPYPIGVHEVTLTVTDDKGASDTCVSTLTVMPTAYCYTTEAIDGLWAIITQDPSSDALRQAIDLLTVSLGEDPPYNTIPQADRVHVVWAGPDRIAQWQGGYDGAGVLGYQQQACEVLETYIQGPGVAYVNEIYDVWQIVAQAHKKLAETALSDADFQGADQAAIERAKTLIKEADTIADILSNEICEASLPKYEQAWKIGVDSLGTVVDWDRNGIVDHDDIINFTETWLNIVAP